MFRLYLGVGKYIMKEISLMKSDANDVRMKEKKLQSMRNLMKEEFLSEKTGIKQKVIQEIVELARENDVVKVILFGSRARGDYKERSDIDLAFCGGNSSRFILDIDEKTSTLLGFDVVDLDKPTKKELLDSINREGVVIYEKV